MTTTTTFDEFAEAFVAALVERGVIFLDPNSETTNLGIGRIYTLLAQRAQQATETDDQRWLVRLRNSLAPSNIGTYDFFLAALRSCQLGFTASPNPRYSEISFRVSRPHAEQFLGTLDVRLRQAARDSADAYLGIQENESLEAHSGGSEIHVDRGHPEVTP